jgi:hypothetical protein
LGEIVEDKEKEMVLGGMKREAPRQRSIAVECFILAPIHELNDVLWGRGSDRQVWSIDGL